MSDGSTGGRVSILLVDDQPEGLLALEAALGPLEQNLVTARSGKEALRQLLREDFAVVLLDVLMPEMDGFETATLVRQRDRTKNTPIIFLTGLSQGAVPRFQAYALGAVDYLVKPFEPEVLRSKVGVLVDLARKTELVRQQAERARQSERREHELEMAEVNRRLEAERGLAREEALREAVRARDEFLSIASHELRTPLTSLKIQVRSALREWGKRTRDTVSVEQATEKVENLGRSVDRLCRLVDNLLDLSRINAGKLSLEISDVDLCEVVREVAARFEQDLRDAGCHLTLDAAGSAVGQWDRMRLEELVTNLLSNAIKYGAGAPIEMMVAPGSESATFIIRDHGVGIAPEDQARIFGAFERAVSGGQQSGFGLGLWIVSRIASAFEGTISVRSEPQAGATFTVTLPCAAAPQQPAESAQAAVHPI